MTMAAPHDQADCCSPKCPLLYLGLESMSAMVGYLIWACTCAYMPNVTSAAHNVLVLLQSSHGNPAAEEELRLLTVLHLCSGVISPSDPGAANRHSTAAGPALAEQQTGIVPPRAHLKVEAAISGLLTSSAVRTAYQEMILQLPEQNRTQANARLHMLEVNKQDLSESNASTTHSRKYVPATGLPSTSEGALDIQCINGICRVLQTNIHWSKVSQHTFQICVQRLGCAVAGWMDFYTAWMDLHGAAVSLQFAHYPVPDMEQNIVFIRECLTSWPVLAIHSYVRVDTDS